MLVSLLYLSIGLILVVVPSYLLFTNTRLSDQRYFALVVPLAIGGGCLFAAATHASTIAIPYPLPNGKIGELSASGGLAGTLLIMVFLWQVRKTKLNSKKTKNEKPKTDEEPPPKVRIGCAPTGCIFEIALAGLLLSPVFVIAGPRLIENPSVELPGFILDLVFAVIFLLGVGIAISIVPAVIIGDVLLLVYSFRSPPIRAARFTAFVLWIALQISIYLLIIE